MATTDKQHNNQNQQNASRSLANQPDAATPTQLMADQRPAAAAQAKFQSLAAHGPHASQTAQLQALAANGPKAQEAAQLQAMSDNSPQSRTIAQLQDTASAHAAPAPAPGTKSANSDLPAQLQQNMESMSGVSLAGTKVHRNSAAPAQLQAHAYAQGSDIHLGPGQDQHLAHEAWHVVQQKQGRVQPTKQMKGKTAINDDKGLEHEADVMGAKAESMAPGAEGAAQLKARGASSSNVAQLNRNTQIGSRANIGFEVEMREFVIRHPNRNWEDINSVVTLTTGGTHGELATDQHAGREACIEWGSEKMRTSDSRKGQRQQDKVDIITNYIKRHPRGYLRDFIAGTHNVFDVGNLKNAYANVKYTYKGNFTSQTQTNVEVPFENVGKDLSGNEQLKNRDTIHLFDGVEEPGSLKAKSSFMKSRVAANSIARHAVEDFVTARGPVVNQNSARSSLASLFTIFLHTIICRSMANGKDGQGVLFKTGAGDLARTALSDAGKSVLWFCIHANNDLVDLLKEQGDAIFRDLMVNDDYEITDTIEEQANKSFKRGDLATSAIGIKKEARYGNEVGGYGNGVNPDMYLQNGHIVDENHLDLDEDYDDIDSRGLAGVATGKDFDVSTHFSNDQTRSAKFLIAEVRRHDMELNKLVGSTDKKLNRRDRDKLAKKLKDIQTPIRLT